MVDLVVKKSYFVGANSGNIHSEYDFGKKLGDGAYGSVFQATHKATQALRAIKQIPKSRIRNPERLETEIRVMKECDHPNIVRLYEVYEDERYMYLVIEHCEGGELFDFIVSKKRLTEKEAAHLFSRMVAAVRYLHAHEIVHRDLKPENLLFLYPPNENPWLKLCDFGLAKMMTAEKRTMVTKAGSAFYIAPEVLDDRGYSHSCDTWSLGVILFILLAGYPPFFGRSDNMIYSKIRSGSYNFNRPEWNGVSESAKDLITRILIVNPQERLSLDQVMAHPWMQEHEALPDNTLDVNFSSLIEYRNSIKLKKAILMCIASQCSDSDITELREAFVKMDTNGDGTLSLEELRAGISAFPEVVGEIESLMQALDVDKNNAIDYTEFIAAMLDSKLDLQEQRLHAAFRLFDRDGSGKISQANLRELLGREGGQDNAFWEAMIRESDQNNDGEIDFNEFMNLMMSREIARVQEIAKPT